MGGTIRRHDFLLAVSKRIGGGDSHSGIGGFTDFGGQESRGGRRRGARWEAG